MLVRNGQTNIDGVVLVVDDSGELKRKNIVLYPGWNEIRPELSAALLGHPYIKAKIRANILSKHPKEALDKCTPLEAQEVVGDTCDVRLLKIWRKLEKRTEVGHAIDSRVHFILNPSKEG